MIDHFKINHYLSLLTEGEELSAAQWAELKSALRSDRKLAAELRAVLAVHGHLGVVFEDEFTSERVRQGIVAKVAESDADDFVSEVKKSIWIRRFCRRFAMAAAIVLLGSLVVFLWRGDDGRDVLSKTVAEVIRMEGVSWPGQVYEVGDLIKEGDVLKISSGLLELEMKGRGRQIMQGPAWVGFPSEEEAIIHRGRLVMRATEKGQGYRVATAQGTIIDRGTEFGVYVSERGMVEAHVMDGSIEAVPNDSASVTLTKNDAYRMEKGKGAMVPGDIGSFYTQLPPRDEQEPRFIHWGFNEGMGSKSTAEGRLGEAGYWQRDLDLKSMKGRTLPRWTAGVHGSGLFFNGLGAYAESGYRGIAGGEPRSVAFWLKVPKDFSTRQGFGIICWGKHESPGEVWQISVNPMEEDGPLGRLRLGLIGGQIIGSTDLRDGEWHHIAVVMYGGSQPDVGTHVILYVNGQMERVSRAALQEVKTAVDDATHGIWLGRNSSYLKKLKQTHGQGGFFRGSMDELYIFDSALSHKKVLEIMEAR